jgi:mannose-6-phosphate isomerase-like protein (cupin superfamily)
MDAAPAARRPVILRPGEGRRYDLGRGEAVFKADDAESAGAYSISEWWLEPETKGPGRHSHHEDDVFYVVEGTVSMFVGDRWLDAPRGSFVLVPGGVVHDFENRTTERAGFLNVSSPGEFEPAMPAIAEWFRDRSPAEARTHPDVDR